MNLPSFTFPFTDIKKILIVKLKHIGDVLLATPCIRALHDTFPKAEISFLVEEGTESMLYNHPLLKEIICFPRSLVKKNRISRISQEFSFVMQLRKRNFDMVVDLTSADRAAWLAWLSGARYRLAHDPYGKGFFAKRYFYSHLAPYPNDPDLHEVKKNLRILEFFQITTTSPRLELYPPEPELIAVDQILQQFGLDQKNKFAVVHPTSRWLFKCWEDQSFAQLIDWLKTHCLLSVVLTSGPSEKEIQRAEQVAALSKTSPLKLLGQLSFTQWAGLVKKASLFIGVDSAPMHVAASQSTPSLAFFGPTGYQNWRPWAVNHVVLAHDCPCSRDRKAHCDWNQTRACMKAISLQEAQDAIKKLLS